MACLVCIFNDSRILLENEKAFAIYDRFPISPDHSLIIPKRQITSFFVAHSEKQISVLDLISKVRQILKKVRNTDGLNIGINDGEVAGQTIMHQHIHLIPRYLGNVGDPRGGVRWIKPEKAQYWDLS